MAETTKVYFECLKDAIPVTKNLEVPLDDTLSIEGDLEEIQVAIKQEGTHITRYSIATITDAIPPSKQ